VILFAPCLRPYRPEDRGQIKAQLGGMPVISGNIAIGYFAGSGTNDALVSNNIYIGPNTATSTTGVSNSIMLGSGATSGVSNEFMISNIDHLNIPSLTTSTDGTGTLLQWGGANVGWIQASGGTYNTVSKIDSAISAIKNNYIFFTYDGGVFNYTVPDGINLISIEAAGGGAPGNSAINSGATNENATTIWQGGGGGGSGQFGSITIPVSSGGAFEFSFGSGGVDSAIPTPATATTILYYGALVLTCNGASSGSGMNGGSGTSLAEGVFNTYSCGGGEGMDIDGGGSLGSGGSGSSSAFNGTSSAAWEAGNSGNGGLNNLGQNSPSSGSGSGGAGGGPTPGLNGCGGNGGSGEGNGPYYGQAGGGGYIKFTMY